MWYQGILAKARHFGGVVKSALHWGAKAQPTAGQKASETAPAGVEKPQPARPKGPRISGTAPATLEQRRQRAARRRQRRKLHQRAKAAGRRNRRRKRKAAGL